MRRRVVRKWRPPLWFVLGGTLAAVFALPVLGIGYFRLAGNILGWWETILLIIFLAGTVTLILGLLLWRLVLRPVTALTGYARAVAEGDESRTIPEHFGTPEFSTLAESVIGMGETLQGREAVLRSYADHVTHELKSPLTALRAAAELLDDPGLGAEDRSRLVARIDEAADRMTALLDAQRALARAQEPMAAGTADLEALAREAAAQHPDLTVAVTRDATLPLAPDGLRLVLDQLLGNAAAHGATRVALTASPDRLEIADDGPGISPGNRDRIFEPFFTTAREAGGTGMGLPIVRRMLDAHGATIDLAESRRGARFVIRF